jgi:acyl-coenzyme A thioesterase 13
MVPDGFQPLDPISPFSETVGPLYINGDGVIGVRIEPHHLNRAGRGHGGLLTTVADIALSRAVAITIPPGATLSTADLHIAFLDGAGEGHWLEAAPRLDRIGRSLVHGSCELTSDGNPVGKVLGCFAVRLP